MDDTRIILTTYGDIFLNAENMVIEYEDFIRCIRFSLLRILLASEELKKLFVLDHLYNMDIEELYEWYITRKHKHILLNVEPTDEFISNFTSDDDYISWIKNFEDEEINQLPVLHEGGVNTLYGYKILEFSNSDIIHKTIVYTDRYYEDIESEVKGINNNIIYAYGDFADVLKNNEVNNNSTFIITDVDKINTIKDLNLLEKSSVVLGDYLGYNYDNDELKVNISALQSETLFKFFLANSNDLYSTSENIDDGVVLLSEDDI